MRVGPNSLDMYISQFISDNRYAAVASKTGCDDSVPLGPGPSNPKNPFVRRHVCMYNSDLFIELWIFYCLSATASRTGRGPLAAVRWGPIDRLAAVRWGPIDPLAAVRWGPIDPAIIRQVQLSESNPGSRALE